VAVHPKEARAEAEKIIGRGDPFTPKARRELDYSQGNSVIITWIQSICSSHLLEMSYLDGQKSMF
jgi:hypothetical protein